MSEYTIDNIDYDCNTLSKMCNLVAKRVLKQGKDLSEDNLKAEMEEYLSNGLVEDMPFRIYCISDNDRVKYYQVMMKHLLHILCEQKDCDNKDIMNQMVMPMANQARLFEIADDLVPILQNTKSEDSFMPFPYISLDCRIQIYERNYLGLIAGDVEIGDDGASRTYISVYYNTEEDGVELALEFFAVKNNDYSHLNKHQKKLYYFLNSFCNFLNEPNVKFIENKSNPKNNKRRADRGALPLPTKYTIRISDELRRYVNDFNEGIRSPLSHKFLVRGHFMKFRDKDKYKRIYELSIDSLIDKGYQTDKGGYIKKWKKPFIKGNGIFINKSYKLKVGVTK